MDEAEATLRPLYRSPWRERCAEYALVLRAVGIPCEIRPAAEGFELLVRSRDAARASEEIVLYRRENPHPSDRPAAGHRTLDGLNCACLYGATILTADLLRRNQVFAPDWLEPGKAQAGLILEGEWWRTVTALTLHADSVHLAGNLVFGLLFAFLAGQRLGWGLALSAMVLAGALGNGLNALIQPAAHSSVGASTAVFAALGLVTAAAWRGWDRLFHRWVPIGGGLALLAFLGMEGERTDILAHVAGLLAGGLAGLLLVKPSGRPASLARHQPVLALPGLALILASWWLALAG